MKEVNLKILLKNSDTDKISNIIGIFDEKSNILRYSDDNIEHILDLNKKLLIRENNDFIMKLNFNSKGENNMNIFYKELSRELNFNINIKELKSSTNMLYIKYIINDIENIEYMIEIIK